MNNLFDGFEIIDEQQLNPDEIKKKEKPELETFKDGNYVQLPDIEINRLPKFYNAVKQFSPDLAAKADKFAKQYDAGFQSVAQNIETYEDNDTKNSIFNILTELNSDGTFKYERLHKYLGKDPVRFAIAKDDINNLKEFDRAVQKRLDGGYLRTAQAAFDRLNSNIARLPYFAVSLSNMIPNIGSTIGDWVMGTETPQIEPPKKLLNNPIAEYYDKRALKADPSVNDSVIDLISEGKTAEATDALINQILYNMPTQLVIGAATISGVGIPSLIGMGALSGAEAMKAGKEQGKTPLQNQFYGALSGIAEGVFERIGTYGIIKGMEKPFVSTLRQNTSKVILDAFRRVGGSMVQEGFEEFQTEYAQAAADYLTGNLDAYQGIGSRLANATIVGVGAGFGMTAPMGFVNYGIRANSLQKDIEFWDRIEQLSSESKIKQRSPEAHSEMIDEINNSPDTPSNIYLQVEDIQEFFQDKPEEFNNFVKENELQQQVSAAQETGSPIMIPIAIWAAKYSGSDLSVAMRENMRFSEDGLSMKELQSQKEEVKARISEMQNEISRQFEENRMPEQLVTVREQLMKPKNENGFGMKAEDADAQIAVFMAGANTLSGKRGESLQQWFDRIAPILNIGEPIEFKEQATQDQNTLYQSLDFTDFNDLYSNPTENRQLSDIPAWVLDNLDLPSKPLILKKNIIEKNKWNHPELNSKQSFEIINSAIGNPIKILQSKPLNKPNYYSFIGKTDKNNLVNIELNFNKDNYEIIGWHYIKDSNLEKLEKRVIKEGGLVLIAEDLKSSSAVGLSGFQNYSNNNTSISGKNKPDELFQAQEKPKGSVQFTKAQTVINLFKSADYSTFLHETSHIFFNDMQRIVNSGVADKQLIKDFETLKQFTQDVGGIETRKGQEKLARAFEAYLREGKAPSVKLTNAFRKFRAWLTAIYKSISQLNVEINKDIKNVFDRILASEQEIALAQEYYSQKDTLLNLLNLDNNTKEKGNELLDKSKQSAIETKLKDVMSAYLDSLEWGAQTFDDDIQKEIMDNEIVYQAIYDAVNGESLNADDIKTQYGDAVYRDIKRLQPRMITKKGTKTLEELALDHNYESVDAMLEVFKNTPKRSERMKQLREEKIAEIEQQFRNEIESEMGAEEAIHNDDSLFYLIYQANQLSKKIRKSGERIDSKIYKDAAEEQIAQLSVDKATRPDIFNKSARKYSELTIFEARKGNFEKALEYKKTQIMRHALVQAAIHARDTKLKIESRYSTQKITSKLKNIENNFREKVSFLLNKFELNPVIKSNSENIISLSELDEGLSAVIPEWIEKESGAERTTPYRSLPMYKFIQLDEAIQSIMHYGRDELNSIFDEKLKTVTAVAEESVNNMSNLKSKEAYSEFSTKRKVRDMIDGLLSHTNMIEYVFERADNYSFTKEKSLGVLRQLFDQGIQSEAKYKSIKEGIFEQVKPQFDKLYQAKERIEKGFGGKSFAIPGIDMIPQMQFYGRQWTVERMIAALLNTGNQHNLSVMMQAYNLNLNQVNQISSYFSSEELQSIQSIWNIIDTLWKPLDQAHFDLYNVHLQKVIPEEITLDSMNGIVNLSGGYYPLVFDSKISDKAGKFAEEKDIMQSRKMSVFHKVRPEDGMTKGRVHGHSIPPNLSLSVLFQHISDTARVISHSGFLADLNKLSLNKEWRAEFKSKFGDEQYKVVRDWIAYQANPERRVNNSWERALDKSRKLATLGILGLNLTVGLKQRLSMFSAIKEIGWKEIMKAYGELDKKTSILGLSNAESWQKLTEESNYLNARNGRIDRELNDAMKRLSPFQKKFSLFGRNVTLQDLQDFTFEWIQMNDRATVGVVWKAAYNKYFSENQKKNNMTMEDQHRDAIKKADAIVRTTQPSALPIDLNSLQRTEGVLRLFTSFMTWTFKWGNRLISQNKAWREGAMSTKDYARHVMYEMLLSPWGALLISSIAIDGELPEWWEWLSAPTENSISWIPVIRDIPGTFKYRKPIGSSPAFELLNRGAKAGKSTFDFFANDKDFTDVAWDMGRVAEMLSGIPALNVVKDIKRAGQNVGLIKEDRPGKKKKR